MYFLIGKILFIFVSGDVVKRFCKRYVLVFVLLYIMQLLLSMFNVMEVFVEYIEEFVCIGNIFVFGDLMKFLMFDIIGLVIMGVDFKVLLWQGESQGEIVCFFLEVFNMYLDDKNDFLWWFVFRFFYK